MVEAFGLFCEWRVGFPSGEYEAENNRADSLEIERVMGMSAKPKSQYDTDFYAWAMETAKLIREHKLSEIDFENVAEEIESVGKSQKRELLSRLRILIGHLLKWQFQPGRQGSSWLQTINEQRFSIDLLLKDNPSLRAELDERVSEIYPAARILAIEETGLHKKHFPIDCPYNAQQILSYDFLPE